VLLPGSRPEERLIATVHRFALNFRHCNTYQVAEGTAFAPASAFEDIAVALVTASIGHDGTSIAQRACDEKTVTGLCQLRIALCETDKLLVEWPRNALLQREPVQNVEYRRRRCADAIGATAAVRIGGEGETFMTAELVRRW
jgi:hypothetical protein